MLLYRATILILRNQKMNLRKKSALLRSLIKSSSWTQINNKHKLITTNSKPKSIQIFNWNLLCLTLIILLGVLLKRTRRTRITKSQNLLLMKRIKRQQRMKRTTKAKMLIRQRMTKVWRLMYLQVSTRKRPTWLQRVNWNSKRVTMILCLLEYLISVCLMQLHPSLSLMMTCNLFFVVILTKLLTSCLTRQNTKFWSTYF